MVNFVFINDLHFGIFDTERELNELRQHFLPFIQENDVDIIFLGGDYFDHKLSLGEPFSIMALEFFRDLVNIAQSKNIKIRTIEGTQGHDRFQPRILENCIPEDIKIDYKYYETVNVEELMGMRILYVPEEYPMNIDEYYAPYKKDKFDLMLVHGTWDFINFGGTIDNSRNDINTAPVFKYEEWKDALEHGVSICGHIHGRHGYKDKSGDKIIYPGSFTAWSFDQISPRGFLYGQYDTEHHKLTYKFINNPDSPTYANLSVEDLKLDLATATLEEIAAKINEQAEKVNNLKVNMDALPDDKRLVLKQFYQNVKGIKLDATPKRAASLVKKDTSKFDKYKYLLDDSLTVDKAVQKYIKEEFNVDLALDVIQEILKEEKK